jgi:TPR repeat protein
MKRVLFCCFLLACLRPASAQLANMPGEEMRPQAEKGNAAAQYLLGTWLVMGAPKDKRDPAEAARWLRKSADQNFSAAQFWLAILYEGGIGVPKDPATSTEWLKKAAENNHPQAQFDLACKYEDGDGIPKDDNEANKWLKRAAESENSMAMYNLADKLLRGKGIPKDAKAGVAWLKRAADSGDSKAQFNLGMRYSLGVEVEENDELAFRWLLLSVPQGGGEQSEFSREQVTMAGSKLSTAQRAKAVEWVQERRAAQLEKKRKEKPW